MLVESTAEVKHAGTDKKYTSYFTFQALLLTADSLEVDFSHVRLPFFYVYTAALCEGYERVRCFE